MRLMIVLLLLLLPSRPENPPHRAVPLNAGGQATQTLVASGSARKGDSLQYLLLQGELSILPW